MRALSVLIAAALAGCPAEQLGVPIPPRGEAAISQEDLQRDTWLMLSAGAEPQASSRAAREVAAERLEQRLEQMDLEPAFGGSFRQQAGQDWNLCGRLQGSEPSTVLVAALDGGGGADLGASPVAALISLARATDGLARPRRSLLFCRVAPGGAPSLQDSPPAPWGSVERILLLGPMGGAELGTQAIQAFGREASLASTGPSPVHGTEADGMERLDYRRLASHLRQLYRSQLASEFSEAAAQGR